MHLTSPRMYSNPSPVPKMPVGLVEIMEGLTKEVLRNNPTDIYKFCANHMAKLLEMRDGKPLKKFLSLEEKISIAQEKVRQKAKERRELFDKMVTNLTLSTDATEQEKIQDDISETSEQVSFLKAPIHHDLGQTSEVEISHHAPFETIEYKITNTDNSIKIEISEPTNSLTNSIEEQEDNIDTKILEELTTPITEESNENIGMVPINNNDKIESENSNETKDDSSNHDPILVDGESIIKSPIDLVITPVDTPAFAVMENSTPREVIEEANVELSKDNVAIEEHQQESCDKELQIEDKVTENIAAEDNEKVTENDVSVIKDDSESNNESIEIKAPGEDVNKEEKSQPSNNATYNIEPTPEVEAEKNKNVPETEVHDIEGNNEEVKEENVQVEKDVINIIKEDIDGKPAQTTENNSPNKDIIDLADETPSKPDELKAEDKEQNNNQENKPAINETISAALADIAEEAEKVVDSIKTSDAETGYNTDTTENKSDISPEKVPENNDKDSHLEASNDEKIAKDEDENSKNDNTEQGSIKAMASDEGTDVIDDSSLVESDLSKTEDDTSRIENQDGQNNMDLETAAVTIQKVFRTFLFKSRNSTFDDTNNEETTSLEDEEDSEKKEEYYAAANLTKERRPLGISRMDTVLQTVNEEKSLSLSTDDSSTLSSAATTIQAHVRGFLVRNRLYSNKTASSNSFANSNEGLEAETDQKKTILNIHIVPEEGNYFSRDESLITSMDLSLDACSPPSSVNLHPMSCDIAERRKLLKREDAVQSVSPPSNNSGKLSEESAKDDNEPTLINDIKDEDVIDKADQYSDSGLESEITSTDSTVTGTTVLKNNDFTDTGPSDTDTSENQKQSLVVMGSDESDVVTPFAASPRSTVSVDDEKSSLMHSGEFHDVVLPTKVTRSDTTVVSEFENVMVYFLLWNRSYK